MGLPIHAIGRGTGRGTGRGGTLMGLAIDGNVVHGIARGGQAFISAEDANANGSINIGGQDYLNVNRIKIQQIGGSVDLGLNSYMNHSTNNVTSQLSEYAGQWAILALHSSAFGDTVHSRPFLIPTTPTDEHLSMDNDVWTVLLSRDGPGNFELDVSIDNKHYASGEEARFTIISK